MYTYTGSKPNPLIQPLGAGSKQHVMAWFTLVSTLVCALALFLGGLAVSPKVQSLFVFVQWVNWPPFTWEAPETPSTSWAWWIDRHLGLFNWHCKAHQGLGAETFEVHGSLGIVRGWRLPRSGTGKRVVLYLHGNAGNIAVHHRVKLYETLIAPPLSCDVVTIDYGGFGASDGWWPDEASAVADALAAWTGLPEGELIVWGHSLGTGIATGLISSLIECSTCATPHGLILEAPFTSVPDVAAFWAEAWPVPRSYLPSLESFLHERMYAHRFPTIDRIERIADVVNIAVLHGVHDDVVPYDQGQLVAQRAKSPLITFQRGHEDIVNDSTFVPVLSDVFQSWDEQKGNHTQ